MVSQVGIKMTAFSGELRFYRLFCFVSFSIDECKFGRPPEVSQVENALLWNTQKLTERNNGLQTQQSIAMIENIVSKYILKYNRLELINQGFILALWLWSQWS